MDTRLKYIPIFRCRQEEIKVLKSFDFQDRIFPCIEIIKELIRKPAPNQRKQRTFTSDYIEIVNAIQAAHVFVDLPVHIKKLEGVSDEMVKFFTSVVRKRDQRTKYIQNLAPLSSKIIPVISTYSELTGEQNSIRLQESDLRTSFSILAFRTFLKTFSRDIIQIKSIVQDTDYIIMDWEDAELDLSDGDQMDIVSELNHLSCTVIVHRNALSKNLTNSKLDHGQVIESIDNSLIEKYSRFGGTCFSDYAGIKKDDIKEGGVISPGFMYYDVVQNVFYGYRYKYGSHQKGERPPKLEEFETTIVPDVISSKATYRMDQNALNFLNEENKGWIILNRINAGLESGLSAPKFKRIAMEHYLHCIRERIMNGDLGRD